MQDITIDEQLFPTKCRCRFLQFMANKPDKFGIKFWLRTLPYLGKDEQRPANQSLGEYVVLSLLDPYAKKKSDCDNR